LSLSSTAFQLSKVPTLANIERLAEPDLPADLPHLALGAGA